MRIGCPVWRSPGWVGTVYSKASDQRRSLELYSQCFGTVEGNSTFYSIPPVEWTAAWAKQTCEGFKFCFKVPRRISHELRLLDCQLEFDLFFQSLEPLIKANRLGPTFLQLGPNFSSKEWVALERFLRQLPKEIPWGVELRHGDWFGENRYRFEVDALLSELNISRVHFDASYLHSIQPRTESERESQRRKPKVPAIESYTSQTPLIRLVGSDLVTQEDKASVLHYWQPWIEKIVDLLEKGSLPYVFIHTPDDRYAPDLARSFYRSVQAVLKRRGRISMPELPAFNLKSDVDKPSRSQTMFDFND